MVDSLMSGQLYQFTVAIDPQGHYLGQTVSYPLGPPNFSRSKRYREGAAYVQDSWKLKRTLTLNLGVRWEYFGVQHNKNAALDSDFPSRNRRKARRLAQPTAHRNRYRKTESADCESHIIMTSLPELASLGM